MDHLSLEEIDVDGAIREGMEEVSGDTRMSFLRKGAMAGGAALSGGAILSALIPGAAMAKSHGGAPPSSFGAGDIGILNFALTLEYLESTFYNEGANNNVSHGDRRLQRLVATIQADENAHVRLLKGALGSKAAKKPKFNFGKAVRDRKTFAMTSYALENTGVHAYLGQAPNIHDPKILLTAASIVTVEARHSGAIGLYLGKGIAPSGPLDTGYSASQVLSIVGKTGFITGKG